MWHHICFLSWISRLNSFPGSLAVQSTSISVFNRAEISHANRRQNSFPSYGAHMKRPSHSEPKKRYPLVGSTFDSLNKIIRLNNFFCLKSFLSIVCCYRCNFFVPYEFLILIIVLFSIIIFHHSVGVALLLLLISIFNGFFKKWC